MADDDAVRNPHKRSATRERRSRISLTLIRAVGRRDMGGKIWVDLSCKLGHLGQHMFRGDLAESLRLQGRW
jgi:hypothetical protein